MVRKSEERGFKYHKRSVDDIKKRANARGGDFDSMFKSQFKVYKAKEGKNLIRILPATWDKDAPHYGYDLWINYQIGPDNESYLSLKKMKGERDPLDEARREAQRDGDKDLVKTLSPRQRILMWVIDRNAEDEGPQLFPCPFTLDKAIAALSHDEDTGETFFIDDPDEGNDVRFYKEGAKLMTDYPAEKIRILKSSPLSADKSVKTEWLEFIQENPLPDTLIFYDYAHISETYNGQAPADDEDDDEEPPRKVAKGRNGGHADDEDDEPAPTRRAAKATPAEDDDEDEAPPTRRRATKPDDAEDDEPDDDEEDEAPAPRRRSTKPADEDDDEDETEARVVKSSIRERLSKRRQLAADADD